MRYFYNFLAISLSILTGAMPSVAEDLIVYTENYPPYNFLGPHGDVAGFATQNVRQILDATGLSYEIIMAPWARAVQGVQSYDNALIYTITRTPTREADYNWLVPIASSDFYLFVNADETRKITFQDIERGKYTGVCVSGDLTCEIFSWAGMPKENLQVVTGNATGDFRMVLARRVDMYISNVASNAQLRQQEGFDLALTKPVLKVEREAAFYLAGNKNMPEETRLKIRLAFAKLHMSGAYKLVDLAKK